MKRSVTFLSSIAVLALSAGILPASAAVPDPSTISAAKTPADHEAIAKAYEEEAASLEKMSEMHKNLADTYGQPGGKPWQAAQAKHCKRVAAELAAAAKKRFGHEITGKGFADRAEYALVQTVEDEQWSDHPDVPGEREAEISHTEDDERGEQHVAASPFIGRDPACASPRGRSTGERQQAAARGTPRRYHRHLPKARPRLPSSTDEAMRASRGAERVPAPNRSSSRAPNTPGQLVASPISGLAIAARK